MQEELQERSPEAKFRSFLESSGFRRRTAPHRRVPGILEWLIADRYQSVWIKKV
jgi:hypothetical protein